MEFYENGVGYAIATTDKKDLTTPLEIEIWHNTDTSWHLTAKGCNGTEVIDLVVSSLNKIPRRDDSHNVKIIAIGLCSATIFGCFIGSIIPKEQPSTPALSRIK